MEGIQNCEKFNFKDLEDINEYPVELIEELKKENFDSIILYLDREQRNKKDIMLPILYTIKNEFNTYVVYEYFNDGLQKDMVDLAKEIAKEEPEMLQGSAICSDKKFTEVIKANPDVTKYMSEQLKQDTDVVAELANSGDKEVVNNLAQNVSFTNLLEANVEVTSNPDLMMAYIKEDASVIQYASQELKDSYEFIEKACIDNLETITYVSEHTEEFGTKGLEATKDVLVNTATQKAIEEFEEEEKTLGQENEEDITPEKLEQKKNRQRSIKNNKSFLKKMQDGIQSGEIDPQKAARRARIIKKMCKNMNKKYTQKLDEFIKIDDAIVERKKEEQVIETENMDVKIGLDDIQKITENESLEAINGEALEIKSMVRETEEIEKQGEEYGE